MNKSFFPNDIADEWRPKSLVCGWGDSGDSGDSGGGYNASDFGGDFGGSLSDAYSSNYDASNAYNDASSAFNDAYNGGGFTNYGDNTGSYQGDTFSGSAFTGDQGYNSFSNDGGFQGVSYTDGGNYFGQDYGGTSPSYDSWASQITSDLGNVPGITGYMNGAMDMSGWGPGNYGAWGFNAPSYSPGPFNEAAPAVAPTMESNQPGALGQYGTYQQGPLADQLLTGAPANLGPPSITGQDLVDLADTVRGANRSDLADQLGIMDIGRGVINQNFDPGSPQHFNATFGPFNGYQIGPGGQSGAVYGPYQGVDAPTMGGGVMGPGQFNGAQPAAQTNLGIDPNSAAQAISNALVGAQQNAVNNAPPGLLQYSPGIDPYVGVQHEAPTLDPTVPVSPANPFGPVAPPQMVEPTNPLSINPYPTLHALTPYDAYTAQAAPFLVDSKDQSRFGEDTFQSRFEALPGLITGNQGQFDPGNLAPGKGGIFEAPDPALLGEVRSAVENYPAVAFPNSGALNNQGINGPMGPMEGGGRAGGLAFQQFGPAGEFQGQQQAIAAQELGEQGRAGRNNFDPGLDFSRPSSVLANQDLLDPEAVSRVADDFNSRFGEWGNLNPNTATFIDPATTTSRGPDARDSFNSRFGEWNNLNNPTQWTSDMYLSDKADNARDNFATRFGDLPAARSYDNQNMGRPSNYPTLDEFLGPGRGENQNIGRPNSYPTLAEFLGPGRGQPQNIPFAREAREAPTLQVTVGRAPAAAGRAASQPAFNNSRSQMDSLLAQARTAPTQAARIAALDALNGLISATYGRGPYGSVGRGPYGGDPDPFIAAMLRQGR